MNCRGCKHELKKPFLNLGMHPLSNAFVKKENQTQGEMFYPLETFVCEKCWLVQLNEPAKREEIFTEDYVYFSSFSSLWLKHAEDFAASAVKKLDLNTRSLVVEVASNDGYLLQYFKNVGISVLGIEPSASVADVAIEKGIPTEIEFFGEQSAKKIFKAKEKADLVCANNVLAHVPDLHDFLKGFKFIVKDDGAITFEFPHLLSLMKFVQFDTIYQEHFSYLSLSALAPIFEKIGLRVFDVEKLPTHGGSLRLWVCHAECKKHAEQSTVKATLEEESAEGLTQLKTYELFNRKVSSVRENLLKFLLQCQHDNKKVAAYGAAAKGNTLLNYCGIRSDLVQMVADKNPVKQNRLLPGSRIPVVSPEELIKHKPDFIVIFPWNLRSEISQQLEAARSWNAKFVVAIPQLEVF
jgi:SAM-dependent methyltransferase